MTRVHLSLLAALLLPAACAPAGEPDDDAADDDTADDDAADDDTADDDTVPPDTFCADLGLTARPFDATAVGADFDEVAGDFSFETLEGTFTLSEAWSGCDAYVFIVYDGSYTYPEDLADSAADDWLSDMPPNARFFFLSWESDDADVLADVESIKNSVANGLHRLDDDSRLYWRERIHYVTRSVRDVGGWVEALADDYTDFDSRLFAFGIDRTQKIREIGYLSDPSTGWASADIAFTRYEVEGFNHQSDLEDRNGADGATVVRLWDRQEMSDPGWAGVSSFAEVTLPDAATMAGFDTLTVDLSMECLGHPEGDYCPAWDYIVNAYVCDVGDPDDCSTELGRWITTYWRPGRWLVDASHFLAELADGGPRRFRFYTQQPYRVTMDLRFSNQGKGGTPVTMEPLWTGGSWDESYNTLHPDVTFTPPAGTTRVELVAVITGHGFGADVENCAEFCNHEHHFTVNGADGYVLDHPIAGSAYGCAEQVPEGTVPNQSGTWVYGRGGWCPGKQVDPFVADITSAVTVGEENTVSYLGLFEGQDYTPVPVGGGTGFFGSIEMRSWLVYSR
ncbi:hypothetical protein L6R50_04485 [Myxococcota bacterium]|nr:hypothetical protein [Myxococcota bacterium]